MNCLQTDVCFFYILNPCVSYSLSILISKWTLLPITQKNSKQKLKNRDLSCTLIFKSLLILGTYSLFHTFFILLIRVSSLFTFSLSKIIYFTPFTLIVPDFRFWYYLFHLNPSYEHHLPQNPNPLISWHNLPKLSF